MAEHEGLVDRFNQSQRTLTDAVSGLGEQKVSEVWLGSWGVKQIVAHIAGWETAMTEALGKMARGERPTAEGINLSDTDGTNEMFVQRAAGEGWQQLLADLDSAGTRFAAAIRALPADRLEEGKTGRRIIETMIGHPEEHIGQIVDWRQSAGA